MASPLPLRREAEHAELRCLPEVSLAAARAERDEARKLPANGADPSLQRKLDKLAVAKAARNTFAALVED
jgi:hypothetical protein